MPVGGKTRFEQSDNAQAAVEVESRLIVGQRVCQQPTTRSSWCDAGERRRGGRVGEGVLTDSGFAARPRSTRSNTTTKGNPPASPCWPDTLQITPANRGARFRIIKQAIGFRRFMLRGLEKVSLNGSS